MTDRPEEGAAKSADPLLRALRELPPRGPDPYERRTHALARAAFVEASGKGGLARARGAVVPAFLASVVGGYLFWAFTIAIAINQ